MYRSVYGKYRYEIFLGVFFLVVYPILNLQMFFELYRSLAFNVVPNDPYQKLIAYFAGDMPSNYVPQVQMLLRPLAALVLVPLYDWMPAVPLKLMPAGIDTLYIRGSAAIAAAAYIFTHLASWATYIYSRSLGRSLTVSFVAALLVVPAIHGIRIHTLDSMAVFMLAVIFALWRKPAVQLALLVPSIFINEKIVIVVGAIYFFRWCHLFLVTRRIVAAEALVFTGALIGFVVYLVIAAWVSRNSAVPLAPAQFEIDQYGHSLIGALGVVFSVKGFVQVDLPVFLLVFLFWSATRVRAGLSKLELLAPLTLFLIAAGSDVKWNIGSIAFIAFVVPLPFFAEWCLSLLAFYHGLRMARLGATSPS